MNEQPDLETYLFCNETAMKDYYMHKESQA